ncbi:hypothetical protein [Streptomyces nigra]
MTRPELTELDHLREVERLARAVVGAAAGECWLSYAVPDPPGLVRTHDFSPH